MNTEGQIVVPEPAATIPKPVLDVLISGRSSLGASYDVDLPSAGGYGAGLIESRATLEEGVRASLEAVAAKICFKGDKQDQPVALGRTPSDGLLIGLRATLVASVEALKVDPSNANARKVLFNVLEQCSCFVEQNIVVPGCNSRTDDTRNLVFQVFHRLGKILGRNSIEAVKADAKVMLASLGDRIAYNPGLGRSSTTNPNDHIATVVEPLLDADTRALAFDMNTYRVPSMMRFYNLLAAWRSRDKDIGKVTALKK